MLKIQKTALSLIAGGACFLATHASATITDFVFINGLLGENVTTPTGSSGSGTITTLQYDDAVGAFGTFTVNVAFTGLSANAIASHIHGPAAVGVNGGVIQSLSVAAATSGSITGLWTLADASDVNDLFTDLTYINIHSGAFPGGELRGQLTPVPEPQTVALLSGAGVLLFVAVRRRLKK